MKHSKLNSRFFTIGFFLLIVFQTFSNSAFSQEVIETQDKSEEMKALERVYKWRSISEKITRDIEEDTKRGYPARPLVLAKLALLWWEKDNYSSRRWLKEAVSESIYERMTETEDEKAGRFEVAAKLIKFVLPKDENLADDLVEYVSENSNFQRLNPVVADELVKAALMIADEKPESAKILGTTSLKFGQSYKLYLLIREINLKDEELADKLLSEALSSVYRNKDADTSIGLMSALSNLVLRTHQGKQVSERAQRQYLDGLYNLIHFEQNSYKSCIFNDIAINLLAVYEDISPGKAAQIRRTAEKCENVQDPGLGLSISGSHLRKEVPETVDELIRAAKKTNSISLKGTYFQKALEKLYYSKKYEEVLSVLGDMNEKDKTAFGEDSWNSWWAEAAREACITHLQAEQISNAYRIIDKTPKELRPSVQSALANKFKESDKGFAIKMLNDARKGLEAFEIKPNHKAGLLIYLVRQYADLAPFETLGVLRDAVEAVNKSDDENEKDELLKDFAPTEDIIRLPVFLLEAEELNTLQTISNIKKPHSRIRFRLGLLEKALEKFNESSI